MYTHMTSLISCQFRACGQEECGWPRTKTLCWCPGSGSCQTLARSPALGQVTSMASPSPISPSPTKRAPWMAGLLKSPPVRAKAVLGSPKQNSIPPELVWTPKPRRKWSSFQQEASRCLLRHKKRLLIAIQATPSSCLLSGLPTDSGKFSQGHILIRLKEHTKTTGNPLKGLTRTNVSITHETWGAENMLMAFAARQEDTNLHSVVFLSLRRCGLTSNKRYTIWISCCCEMQIYIYICIYLCLFILLLHKQSRYLFLAKNHCLIETIHSGKVLIENSKLPAAGIYLCEGN